jgi:hypothetical protein
LYEPSLSYMHFPSLSTSHPSITYSEKRGKEKATPEKKEKKTAKHLALFIMHPNVPLKKCRKKMV